MGCQNVRTIEDTKKIKSQLITYDEQQFWGDKRTFIELEQGQESIPKEIKFASKNIDFYKEFAKRFDYFNICRYDPNYSHDCLQFKEAFEKVDVIRGFSIDSIVNYFNNYKGIEEFI